MSGLMHRAKKMVGSRISIKNEDYGVVIDVVSILKNDKTFVVFVTDKNRKVEASSALANLTSATNKKVYPDGTDYSKRFAGPKPIYKASPAFCANIDSTVRINKQVINITSYLSSSDVMDEDDNNRKGNDNV